MSKPQKHQTRPTDVAMPSADDPSSIELPRPTVWPLILALGIALTAAGLVTNLALSIAGLLAALVALFGWIRELSPTVGSELVALRPRHEWPRPIAPAPAAVEPLRAGMPGHRMRIPERVHPYSAGVKGGAAGGVAMALTALAYGALSGRGIWYPVNLLAGMVLPGIAGYSYEQLAQFDATALVAAVVIHVVASLSVGLFFGILLPTLPRGPLLWGGIVSPLLWTGGVFAVMRVVNPVMNELVDWPWFFVSQIAYGISAGIVVVRSEKIYVNRERRRLGRSAPTK